MKVLMVLAHPYQKSFNYAIKDAMLAGFAKGGHEVRLRDLYVEGFDPVLGSEELAALQAGRISPEIEKEQALVNWADALVFIYPLWWYDRPAILKGWCDRVFTYDYAFTYDHKGKQQGLLGHKRAAVVITAGGSEDDFERRGISTEQLTFPMTRGTLAFCGIDHVDSQVLFSVGEVDADDRQMMLQELSAFAEQF